MNQDTIPSFFSQSILAYLSNPSSHAYLSHAYLLSTPFLTTTTFLYRCYSGSCGRCSSSTGSATRCHDGQPLPTGIASATASATLLRLLLLLLPTRLLLLLLLLLLRLLLLLLLLQLHY